MSNSTDISQQIAQIDSRLAAIEDEKQSLVQQRQMLLAQYEAQLALHFNKYAPAEAKVALFLSYFKGRNDIYPFRWENKQGRSGYSPACQNEWIQGICDKPKIKCTDCPNQAFKLYDEQAVYSHLNGAQTIGIYPLLNDNTTHLLAADFDKEDWFETIVVFAKTCELLNIPYLLERSRSGNGGHVWIFFKEAVTAANARKLGIALLHKAMEQYPALSFDCFDRLFPNQDIMPEGGFGNLIALPLQLGPRQLGNSTFIEIDGKASSDVWAKLASVGRVSTPQLDQLLLELKEHTHSVGEGQNDLKPWRKHSSQTKDKISNCPEQLTIVLVDQIYIPIEQLPGKLTSKLKHCAVFPNPEFYKRQAMHYSTFGTSRLIWSVHIEGGYLILPRGCLTAIKTILEAQHIALNYDDKRSSGSQLKKINFAGKLKSQQTKAVNALIKQDNGILVAPTGFGKTVVALALIAKRKINTLILVHSRQLAEQWLERAAVFLENVSVGSLLGGKDKLTGQVDIATYQSLISKNGREINGAIENYGQLLIDECHHLPAANYDCLIKSSAAKYIHGITATPTRQDGLEKLMHFQLGDIVHKAKVEAKSFEQLVIARATAIQFPNQWHDTQSKPHISEVYKYLYTNQNRNDQIVADIVQSVAAKHSVMVLTERKEHIELLSDLLEEQEIQVVKLHGGISAKQRKVRIEFIQDKKDQPFVIVATGKYVGEGFDLPYLDTLFITLPIAWKGILAQYAGRIQREWSNKELIRVFDYVDEFAMLKRMWAKREKGYKMLGYLFEATDRLL